MKHHVKLVKGVQDDIAPEINKTETDKRILTTLSVSLTKEELKRMKAVSGLVGSVSNDQIIKAYLKERMHYGY